MDVVDVIVVIVVVVFIVVMIVIGIVFSEGYRRYLALGFTLFVRTYVRAFLFLRFVFLSKRPSL